MLALSEAQQRIVDAFKYGDAFGARFEFQRPTVGEWDRRYIPTFRKPGWGPGTDDTEMMMCLLESIQQHGRFVREDVLKRYIQWMDSEPPDIGDTVRKALNCHKWGTPIERVISDRDQGNGSLMRCLPLAFLSYENESDFEDDVRAQAILTHTSEICARADLVYLKTIMAKLKDDSKAHVSNAFWQNVRAHLPELEAQIDALSRLEWSELLSSGWVIHSLGCIGWALRSELSFEDSIAAIANRGDDADTNAALVAAVNC